MSLQFIIDGYNIINHPQFTRAHKHSLDPRIALITFIKTKRLTGSLKNTVVIVFDGYPPGDQDFVDCGVNVIFSRKISADEKIKMLVQNLAQRRNIVVVSDDNEIKFASRSLGARACGVEEFIGEKKKTKALRVEPLPEAELSYTQKHKINAELRKLWLKE